MRLLFLNYEYPPLGGGAANANQYIFKEFSKIPNLEVELITSSIDKKYIQEKIGDSIIVHRLPIGKNPQNLHHQSVKDLLIYSWKAYKFSKKLAKSKKFDLIHAFFTLPCGLIAYLIGKKYHLPFIVSLRGSDVPGYSERFSFIYKLFTPLFTFLWKKSFKTVANSQGLKELAQKSVSQQEIEIIPNGVDTNQFKPDFELRKQNEENTILCISRLTQRKGINYLIEAFSLILPKFPDTKLVLAGEGNMEKDLKAQARKLKLESKVKFLGRIPHEDLPKIYSRSEIFVLPSLNEGMSNTILEAISSGLPIIATDTGGSKELITENENGFIVAMKNSRVIAEKLEVLLKDNFLREKMSLASRVRAELMSWESVSEQYYNLYKKALN